jgi:hypothetical protein
MKGTCVGGKVDEDDGQKGEDDDYGHATSRMIGDA